MTEILYDNERLDSLSATDFQIIQSPEVFSYGIDAVLLAHFPRVPKRGRILDFCAGNGAVGLTLASRTAAQIELIEIQNRLADMACRSIRLNQLEQQVTVRCENLIDSPQKIGSNQADLITCNPPYFKISEDSKLNSSEHYSLARHELTINFSQICKAAQQILKGQGHFALIHRPERFLEILSALTEHHLMPKRIQFVYPKANEPANLVLIDAIKDARPGGEIFLPPLIVHQANGAYTNEILKIYGMK